MGTGRVLFLVCDTQATEFKAKLTRAAAAETLSTLA